MEIIIKEERDVYNYHITKAINDSIEYEIIYELKKRKTRMIRMFVYSRYEGKKIYTYHDVSREAMGEPDCINELILGHEVGKKNLLKREGILKL